MPRTKNDKTRERRIATEIVVDAYGEEERALGWYYYLEEKLEFPFKARCIVQREISPLTPGEEVKVLKLASEDECEREIFVTVSRGKRKFAVPLFQLMGVKVNAGTRQAIEDWHYWLRQGYEF